MSLSLSAEEVLGDGHLGASKCTWRFAFMGMSRKSPAETDEAGVVCLCSCAFGLVRTSWRCSSSCNRRHAGNIQESQPIPQKRKDASWVLSLYYKTEDNTHYNFQEALTSSSGCPLPS